MISFYIIYAVFYLIYRSISSSHLIYLLLCGIMVIYEPAMFFLAGRDIMSQKEKPSSSFPSFRSFMAKRALTLFSAYGIIGIIALFFFYDQEIYLSIRNILAFNIVPGLSGILASLGFLYLLSGLFLPQLEQHDQKKRIIAVISICGFLMVFIPEKLFGYALIGIFIGGDKFGCVPIATHLAAFFWGMYTVSPGKLSLKDKWNWILLLVFTAASACFIVLRQKEALFLSAGTMASFFAVLTVSPFHQILRKTHLPIRKLNLLSALRRSVISLDDTVQGRLIDKENRKRILIYLAGYIILFLFTAAFIFLPVMRRGQSLVWDFDALSQYIPKIHRFIRYIPEVFRNLIHGRLDIPQYDYTSGLGSTISISFEPLYWLYLILPKGNLDVVYTIMTIVRYFLSGLSLSVMLIYFRRSYLSTYIASLAYAFSGYSLFAGTRHYQFITPMILIPLLVVAIERLIRYKKWYMMTILVTVSLLCSYYFLYMNTIALGFYFICRILGTREYRNIRTFSTRGLMIIGSYALGASMGVISIATSFGSYLGSGRSEDSMLDKLVASFSLFYRQSWISDVFLSSVSYNFTPGFWLKIGSVPLALFGAVLIFTRKNRNDLRLLFILFTSFCIMPVAAFVFGGFSTVTNRWSYIYTVLSGFLIAICMDEMDRLTRKDIIALTGVTVYYALLVFFDARMQSLTMYADLAFLALTLCMILMLNGKNVHFSPYAGKVIVSGLTILILIFNGSHFVSQKDSNGNPFPNYTAYNSLKRISATSLKDLDQIPEYKNSKDFFRSANLKGSSATNCFSMINGHNDIGIFSSTLTGSVVDYNRMMGNTSWSLVRVFDYNFRTFMHALASVKYLGSTSDKYQSIVPYGFKKIYTTDRGIPIYENQLALPLGYTYDTVIPASAAQKEPAVRRQEMTMAAAIVDDNQKTDLSNLGQKINTPLTSHEIPFDVTYDGIEIEDGLLKINKSNASMTLTFESDPNAETYLVYSGLVKSINNGDVQNKWAVVTQGENKYRYRFRTDAYKTDQTEYVLNLGYHKEKIYSCTLTFEKAGSIDFEGLALYSQPMDHYEEIIRDRCENVLEDISIDNNTVSGSIELDHDKMLVITFPYQKGWKAYIDGREAPIYRTNYQYMGLNLTRGKHDIRLHYQIPGFRLALYVTAGSFFLFLLIIFVNHYRKKSK